MKILIVVPSYIEILSWNNQEFMECQPRLLLLTRIQAVTYSFPSWTNNLSKGSQWATFFDHSTKKPHRNAYQETPRLFQDSFKGVVFFMVRRSISRQISENIPLFYRQSFLQKVDRICPPMHRKLQRWSALGVWCFYYTLELAGGFYHEEFEVPEMEVLNLVRLFRGWVFPYISLTYSLYRWVPAF